MARRLRRAHLATRLGGVEAAIHVHLRCGQTDSRSWQVPHAESKAALEMVELAALRRHVRGRARGRVRPPDVTLRRRLTLHSGDREIQLLFRWVDGQPGATWSDRREDRLRTADLLLATDGSLHHTQLSRRTSGSAIPRGDSSRLDLSWTVSLWSRGDRRDELGLRRQRSSISSAFLTRRSTRRSKSRRPRANPAISLAVSEAARPDSSAAWEAYADWMRGARQ